MADPGSRAATGRSRGLPRPTGPVPALSLADSALGRVAIRSRPRAEKIELSVNWGSPAATTAAATATGRLGKLLLFFFLPIRLSLMWLGYAFDYLAHRGLMATARENPFKAARNRDGSERMVSPPLLYQNYHLVHHLHTRIPFHRYVAAWRRNEEEYLAHPPLTDLRGRPLSLDEYRRRRALAGRLESGGGGVSNRTGWGG
jgi:ring-1,2-phenylacetyl-CoA epoxidase subunit PaaE